MKTNTKKAAKPTNAETEAALSPVYTLPLELLVEHPEVKNRQLDKDWVGELKDSILNNGLDTPLFVWDGGEEYGKMMVGKVEHDSSFVIAGMHRRAALRAIRKEDPNRYAELFPNGIPVRMFTGTMQDMLLLQLRENINRKNPTVEELLPQVLRLRDAFKMKNKVIAARIGRSEAYVSNLLALEAELGEDGVKDIIAGNVDAKDALEAVKELKATRKAGKETAATKKNVLDKAKAKSASRKEQGRERDERRVSFKKLWEIYKSLPDHASAEEGLKTLEGLCSYVAGDRDTIPKVLKTEAKKASKEEEED